MLDNLENSIPLTRLRSDERKVKVTFIVFVLMILIMLANLLWLNTQLLNPNKKNNESAATIVAVPTQAPQSAVSAPSTTPSPASSPAAEEITITPQVKEYFIPLGSGTSNSTDWVDVPGVVASVDLGNYGKVKSIVFEASITFPASSQIVSIRLFNSTDQHPVWNSEIETNNGGYVVSQPLTVDKGVKTYKVQMKTQLQAEAMLSQARIHILL